MDKELIFVIFFNTIGLGFLVPQFNHRKSENVAERNSTSLRYQNKLHIKRRLPTTKGHNIYT
jgi:hypothetical protein